MENMTSGFGRLRRAGGLIVRKLSRFCIQMKHSAVLEGFADLRHQNQSNQNFNLGRTSEVGKQTILFGIIWRSQWKCLTCHP